MPNYYFTNDTLRPVLETNQVIAGLTALSAAEETFYLANKNASKAEIVAQALNSKTPTSRINTQTALTYQFKVTDYDKIIELTNVADVALVVPANATEEIPIGWHTYAYSKNDVVMTITQATGVTVNNADGLIFPAKQLVKLVKTATNEWFLADVQKIYSGSELVTLIDGELGTGWKTGVSALADLDTVVTGTQLDDIKTKIDNIEANATTDQTPAEIKTALETLTTTNRLDASAIKNLPSAPSITVLNNDVSVVNNDSTYVTGLAAVLTRATTAGLVYYEADLMFELSQNNLTFQLTVSETESAINMAANGFFTIINAGGYSLTKTFSSTQSSGQLFSEYVAGYTHYHYIIKGIFNMTGGASVDININFKQASASTNPVILKKGSSAKMWAL